jgi:hypothetical protein
LVDVDEVGSDVGEFDQVFGFDDGEVGGGEPVLAGVLGGCGLTFNGPGARGLRGVGSVCCQLLLGDGFVGFGHMPLISGNTEARQWKAGEFGSDGEDKSWDAAGGA